MRRTRVAPGSRLRGKFLTQNFLVIDRHREQWLHPKFHPDRLRRFRVNSKKPFQLPEGVTLATIVRLHFVAGVFCTPWATLQFDMKKYRTVCRRVWLHAVMTWPTFARIHAMPSQTGDSKPIAIKLTPFERLLNLLECTFLDFRNRPKFR